MDYLFYLQSLREGALAFLSPLLTFFSEGTLTIAPLVAMIFYWSVDKIIGELIIFSFSVSNWLNGIIKLTACVYRPWMLDSRLHLDPSVTETSAGYSFPSGHVAAVASVNGSIALEYRRKKWVTILAAVLTLLLMFARNWVGAHTLVDVVVSSLITVIVILLCRLLFSWFRMHPEKDWLVLSVVVLVCILGEAYIHLKSYPLDYLENGSLVADPVWMRQDSCGATGLLLGFSISTFLERRYIRFSSDGSLKQRVIRGAVGSVIFALLYKVVCKKLFGSLSPSAYLFWRYFCSVVFACLIYPWIIKTLEPKLFMKKAKKSGN